MDTAAAVRSSLVRNPLLPGVPGVPPPARPWLTASDVAVVLGARDARTRRVLLAVAGTARWWGGEPHEDTAHHRALAAAARRCGDVLGAARQDALAVLRGAFEALEGQPQGAAPRSHRPGLPHLVTARPDRGEQAAGEHLALAADPALDAAQRVRHWLAAERARAAASAGEAHRWARRVTAPGAAVVLDIAASAPGGLAVEVAVVDAATGEVLLDSLLDPHAPVTGDPATTHGLHDADLRGAPVLRDVLPALLAVTGGRLLVASGAPAQRRLLLRSAAAAGLDAGALGRPRRWEDLGVRAGDAGLPAAAVGGSRDRSAPVCRRERNLLLTLAGRWAAPPEASPLSPAA